jgi:hypothetical protein
MAILSKKIGRFKALLKNPGLLEQKRGRPVPDPLQTKAARFYPSAATCENMAIIRKKLVWVDTLLKITACSNKREAGQNKHSILFS